ncbi:MAG: Ig-like domain-containing protein [Bacteroidota bacterium]
MKYDIILWLWIYILCSIGIVYAEGTAQLMPAGSSSSCIAYIQGNDGSGKEGPGYGRPSTDLLHVRITDPSTETIYMGFTRKIPSSKTVYYQVLDPEGNIHCTGRVAESSSDAGYIADDGVEAYVGPVVIGGATGYSAIECVPNLAGDYQIQFNVSDSLVATPGESKYFLHPFDVTVADVSDPLNPSAIDGRLFTYRWHINTNSGSNKACMDFYTWTNDSLVIKMEMNEIQPFGFTVSFNSSGTDTTGNIVSDRQSTSSKSLTIPEYPVFLNEPDETAFPSGTPGEVTYMEINACTIEDSYCILVNTTRIGEMNVYIDLDGDGSFTTGGRDVYFPYKTTTAGQLCIPWDGVDGLGDTIEVDQTGLVKVEFLAGIVHFPIWDAENHTNGFDCEVVRPVGMSPLMYFDNTNTSLGNSDLTGCSSGCNSWTSNKGDKVMINTWLNTITSSDQDSFEVGGACPPVAVNDTVCTRPGLSAQYSILDNDWDGDNEIDSSSVAHDTLDASIGRLSFNSESGLLTFFPNGNDSTPVSFDYRIWDKTTDGMGGPLSDTAMVFITITSSCTSAVTLPVQALRLKGDMRPEGFRLRWHGPPPSRHHEFTVEESLDGILFSPIHRTHKQHFVHRNCKKDLGHVVYYRVRMIEQGQTVIMSNTIQVSFMRPSDLGFFIQEGRDCKFITLNYRSPEPVTFMMLDIKGRIMVREEFEEAWVQKRKKIRLPEGQEGIYLFRLFNETQQRSRKHYLYRNR